MNSKLPSTDEYKELIMDGLLDKDLIDEDIYLKCRKPHMYGLPRLNHDLENLTERWHEIERRRNMEATTIMNEENAIDNIKQEKDYWEKVKQDNLKEMEENNKTIEGFRKADEEEYDRKQQIVQDIMGRVNDWGERNSGKDEYEAVKNTEESKGIVQAIRDAKQVLSHKWRENQKDPSVLMGTMFQEDIDKIDEISHRITQYTVDLENKGLGFYSPSWYGIASEIRDLTGHSDYVFGYPDYNDAIIGNRALSSIIESIDRDNAERDKEISKREANVRRHTKYSNELSDAQKVTGARMTEVRERNREQNTINLG